MKKGLLIGMLLLSLAVMGIMTSCSEIGAPTEALNVEADSSEIQRNISADGILQPTYGNVYQTSSFFDWSGKVETRIFYKSTVGTANVVAVNLPDDYVLIGGGALVDFNEQYGDYGAMLTGSFPLKVPTRTYYSGWVAESGDQNVVCYHTTWVFAIGMRLKDMNWNYIPSSTIRNYIQVKYADGQKNAEYSNALATLDSNYKLISGGARVLDPFNKQGTGNAWRQMLTSSRVIYDVRKVINDPDAWEASSNSNTVGSPAQVRSYVIGIKNEYIPGFNGYLRTYNNQGITPTMPNTRGALTLKKHEGWLVSGIDGIVFSSSGRIKASRYLTGLAPLLDGSGVYIMDKDHAVPSLTGTHLGGKVIEIAKNE